MQTVVEQCLAKNVARHFDRGAIHYDQYAEVQAQVMMRLRNLMANDVLRANSIADLGCGTGRLLAECRSINPLARLVGVDISAAMLQRVAALSLEVQLLRKPLEATELASSSMDVVLSSSAIQWVDPQQAMREIYRLCRPTASIGVSCFTSGTLKSWRQLWGGTHQALPTADALKEVALAAGFEAVSILKESRVQPCTSFEQALNTVRGIGAGGNSTCSKPFIGKRELGRVKANIEAQIEETGQFPMEYEVCYLIAAKPEASA